MKLLPSKRELINTKVLDQITFIISLRTFLSSLRMHELAKAINSMELSLDCAISSIVLDAERCDAATKELMRAEFKRLWLYRNKNPEDVSVVVAGLDEETRKRYLDLRVEVDKILGEFRQAS